MPAETNNFLKLLQHPFKFRLFLFSQLPSAFFSGVRVKSISQSTAVVTVPYKWFTQNPFKSTYFACLAMAAEMSTGLLAMLNTYKSKPPISMLVVSLEALYYKKASGLTLFTCNDGAAIAAAIEHALATGVGQEIKVKSTGKNSEGVLVAEFFITWSFKHKS